VDGRDGWMCGIGAVLTVPGHRGGGHASRLVEQVVEQSREEGAILAGLFSEIGTAFYERLGFSVVALDEVSIRVSRRDGSPAMLVRFGDDRDLPAIAAMHAVRTADARLAMRRDAPLVHYAISKKRLFAGLSAPGTRQLEFFVAEEGASAVAYVVLSQNHYGWTLEEAGDRDPSGARLGAMFEVLLAREPSLRDPIVRAWWPRGFPTPPQLTLSNRTAPKDIFMVRPLAAGIDVPAGPEGVFWWRSDYF
jgi:predicted N-acetyltransferase YhbS